MGSAITRELGEEKPPNVFLASKHYNMKIHDKKNEYKHTESYTGLDYKDENLNGKSGGHLQALIMAPIFNSASFRGEPGDCIQVVVEYLLI